MGKDNNKINHEKNLARREAEFNAFNESREKQSLRTAFSDEEQKLIEALVFGEPQTEKDKLDEDKLDEKQRQLIEQVRLYDDDGNYVLSKNPDSQNALLAIKVLKETGCNLSQIETLGSAMTPKEFYDEVTKRGKPKPQNEIRDENGDIVERDTEKTYVATLSRGDKPVDVETSAFTVRLSERHSSIKGEMGVNIEVFTRGELTNRVNVYSDELKPGLNTIPGTEITVNLVLGEEGTANIEISEKGNDLEAKNNPSSKYTETNLDELTDTEPETTTQEDTGSFNFINAQSNVEDTSRRNELSQAHKESLSTENTDATSIGTNESTSFDIESQGSENINSHQEETQPSDNVVGVDFSRRSNQAEPQGWDGEEPNQRIAA